MGSPAELTKKDVATVAEKVLASKKKGANGVRAPKEQTKPLNLADRLASARAKRSEATISALSAPAGPAAEVVMVAWSLIDPSPLNPRKHFEAEPLQELAENIAEVGGVKQNVLVRPREDAPGRFWLIAGERRYRAVGLLVEAGRVPPEYSVPARVEQGCDDRRHLELAMIENLQREGLNPMEEAEGYAALVAQGMTAGEIAREILGRPERARYVQLRLNLVGKLHAAVQDALLECRITVEQARALVLAPKEEQAQHLKSIESGAWNYRTTEGIRQQVKTAWLPVKQCPKLRKAYEARGGEIVTDDDAGEELYAKPLLLREIMDEEIEAKRAELSVTYAWVVVLGGHRQGHYQEWDYETRPGHELAGAVIHVGIGSGAGFTVRKDLVRKADLRKVAEGRSVKVDPETGKSAIEAEPWTKAHLIRARNRKSQAMRAAVARDVDAAKRLVCLALLGAQTCVDIGTNNARGSDNAGFNPPTALETVNFFLQRCGGRLAPPSVSEAGRVHSVWSPEKQAAVWLALDALKEEALDRLFSSLVALRVGTFNDFDPQPGDTPVAVEIARSLGIVGAEAKHGLEMEPEDLDGLRKGGLLAACRLAGVKVGDSFGGTSKGIREALGGVTKETTMPILERFVLPTLRFASKAEVLAEMNGKRESE